MTVTKLKPVTVGDDYRFDPDELLDSAKGQSFDRLLIVGELTDADAPWVSSNVNKGEALILLERAKQWIIFGRT